MNNTQHHPLCVDLDGTLVQTDTLVELFLTLFKKQPLVLLPALGWLWRGKAYFKKQVYSRSSITIERLPYHRALLAYLREQQAQGRKLVLVTASSQGLASGVAGYLGIFSDVLGSTAINYAGKNKAALLVDRFGKKGFSYIGNSWADLPVWAAAASGSVVSSNPVLIAWAKRAVLLEHVFAGPRPSWQQWLRALRIKQWIKNLLVFVPLIAAHQVTDSNRIQSAVLAFLAFAAASSGVYIINDLLDLEADRQHPTKKNRPFAAGTIPLSRGIAAVPFLLVMSVAVGLLLPYRFLFLLGLYLGLTLLYSFRLKRVVLVDVFLLSMLYTIRIFAGAAAIMVPVSSWLTAFALFFFLSLAMVKRFTELRRLKHQEVLKAHGRGYITSDAELLAQFGLSSGLISAVILALYISSPEIYSLYTAPELLWLIIPLLLFWIGRVWFLAHRGRLDEDPTTFAVKDLTSYGIAALTLFIVFAATQISL